jgi:steroid 5-alpha reductase family enzyme
VWRYSRHPNYLGEASFWWGLFFIGLGADEPGKWWWTGVGALAITAMLLFASIPMMEKRQLERRPETYAAYKARVPSPLLFWPRNEAAENTQEATRILGKGIRQTSSMRPSRTASATDHS